MQKSNAHIILDLSKTENMVNITSSTNGTGKYAIAEMVYFNNFCPATYTHTKAGISVKTRNGEKFFITLSGQIVKK